MTPVSDILLILYTYIVSLVWQLIAWPWMFRLFPRSVDKGWAVGRVFTTLTTALIVWFLALAGIKANTDGILFFLVIVMIGLSVRSIVRDKKALLEEIARNKHIRVEELLMFLGILIYGFTRAYIPNLNLSEKFMDFGFINQYLDSPTLPAKDMWFAGHSINYYSFGHFWISVMIRWIHIKPTICFNLISSLFFGMSLAISYSVAANIMITKKYIFQFWSGLVSALLLSLGGNTYIVWFLFTKRSFAEDGVPFWYALSTRFVDRTIIEFPAYVFTVGDIHAHIIDFLIVLTFLFVFTQWTKGRKRGGWLYKQEICLGILLGVMMMANTWDYATYGLFMAIYFLVNSIGNRKIPIGLLARLALVFFVSIIISLPWLLSFKMIPGGVRMVQEGTPFWQLMAIWGAQLFFGVVALLVSKNKKLVLVFFLTSVSLIAMTEVIYIKDMYEDMPRMNTVFKLTFQSFILLTLLGGMTIVELFDKWRKNKNLFVFATLCLQAFLVFVLLLYPFTSYTNITERFKLYQGLDAEKYYSRDEPDRYAMVQYLRMNKDSRNLVDYPGTSFTNDSAIPVLSGVPAVLGWPVHEQLWRSDADEVRRREKNIAKVYESSELEEVREIIRKYNVGWIVVGYDERLQYVIDERNLLKLGTIVWQNGYSYLLKVNDF